MNISWLLICFIFYSFLGWIWETIYCTIKEKKFQNRGFLFGPICPIYGFCILVLQIVVEYFSVEEVETFSMWQIFLISMIGSAIMEFTTSIYLEKRFHARWWDYSKLPLNVKGRISLPVSIAFGFAGIVVARFMLPFVSGVSNSIPYFLIEILALVAAGVLGADFAATEASLSDLLQRLAAYEMEFTFAGEEAYQRFAKWSMKLNRRQQYIINNLRSLTIGKSSINLELSNSVLKLIKEKEEEYKDLYK